MEDTTAVASDVKILGFVETGAALRSTTERLVQGSVVMATGDIASCSINSNGLLAIIRITNFGTGTTAFDPTKPPTFTVVSEGYSGDTLTTFTRTVKGVKVFAKGVSGGDLDVELELDAPIYNDDKNAVNGSGTDPTVTVQSGWFTRTQSGITISANSNSNVAVTNNSGLDYPKAIGRWVTPSCQRYTAPWDEDVVAFGLYTDASYPFGIARVKFIVEDSNDDPCTINRDIPTSVSRAVGGFGPAATYRLWRATFDPANRDFGSPATPFAKGAGARKFEVYPRLGDQDSVFKSIDASANSIGERASEIEIDAADADGSGLAVAECYVDSTSTVTGTLGGASSFADREFAVAASGGSTVVIKVIDYTSGSPGTLRFNFLALEELYSVAVTSLATGVTPTPGDIMVYVENTGSGDVATTGMVLKYTANNSTSGTVIYQKIGGRHYSSGLVVSFKYRSGTGEDFAVRTTGVLGTPATYGAGTSIPSGATITGLESGTTLSSLGSVTASGSDSAAGTSGSPRATVFSALERARSLRNNPGGLALEPYGCRIYLKPGDYVLGPRLNDYAGSDSEGYWCTLLSADTNKRARIVGCTGDVPGLGLRRMKIEGLRIHSPGVGRMVEIHASVMRAVLWVDGCTITGNSCIGSDEVWGGQWGSVFMTRCDARENGIGPMVSATILRDSKVTDIGGDCLTDTRANVNILLDLCNGNGNAAIHGDVGQYEGGSSPPSSWDNIVWFNVLASRMRLRQPAPNNGGQSGSSFTNAAFVNVVQGIYGINRLGGFQAPTLRNILMWNCTNEGDFRIGSASTVTLENLSIRSCYFEAMRTNLVDMFIYTAWFRNNHYLTTGSGYITPGVNASTDETRDDLFVKWDYPDGADPDYYRPDANAGSALCGQVPSGEVMIGYDLYNADHSDGDIGGISS